MARSTVPYWMAATAQTPRLRDNARPSLETASMLVNLLIVAIFLADLFTPFLIWKGVLPSATRWLSDFATLAAVTILFLRMIVFDRFPVAIWLIAALSALGIAQATFQGQDFLTTIWGWWKTFQFPLLAIFAYLNPHWPKQFPQKLRMLCVGILLFQVMVQLGQYATGEVVGDNLAGTFGRKGVSQLLLFSVLTLSYTLGYGAIKGDWRLFLGTFVLGTVASVLAENKIFPVASLLLASGAGCVYLYLGGKFSRLLPSVGLLGAGLLLFLVGYNLFVPAAERRPLQQYLFDPEVRESYNTRIRQSDDNAPTDFNIGRTFAMQYGWEFITSETDRTVLLFGLGLGARTESSTLGAGGIAFQRDGLGLTRGTGMLVLMQEMGLLGMLAMGSFTLWLSYQLLVDLKRYPHADAAELRTALLIFTLLWPLWLWYKPVFWIRVAMLLYWVTVGYVLRQRKFDQEQAAAERDQQQLQQWQRQLTVTP